ncbi:hypothetical protein SKTS_26320 [Sulfurimicrobium lacus]|uniref:Uncharacterized protein n=1 Tax=Sulfurimicrobium lacus TaxID=2715678 RepID=A0A6F8VFE2_9PROT|nr:hypothetical protein [Sulfurimicrobium lacus]BCB27746.1 hypothetical protein SKTS_26320 [Sulfurimicrobium lacus]
MGRQLALVFLCLMLSGLARAERTALPAELWDSPRSAALIVAQPVLQHSVAELLAHPHARLLIHHGASDEAVSQAEELRAWLIALAVDSKRIELNTENDARGLNLELVGITLENKGNP